MKHLRHLLILFVFCSSADIPAAPVQEPVQPTSRGSLKIGETVFTVRCFDAKWRNFTQESAFFRVTGQQQKQSRYQLEAEIRHPDFPAGSFRESLTRQPRGNYRYRAELSFRSPARFNDIAFAAAALPVSKFSGRELFIDGKKTIVLPRTHQKKSGSTLFRGKAATLILPLAKYKLTFRGKLDLLLQDDRAFGKEVYTLRLYFSPARGAVTDSSIDLDIDVQPYRSTPLDLSAAANAGFADETADDRKGGWTDQGSENDLSMLPTGRQRWNNVNFDIIDPARNNGRSCIMLAGPFRHYFPRTAQAEQKKKVSGEYLHLLHATAWPTPDRPVGTIELVYTDGTGSTLKVSSYDVGNWWAPVPRRSGEVVWSSENRSSYVGLYRSSYPIENKPIRSIAFHTSGQAVWGIVAASVGDGPLPRYGRQPHYIRAGNAWQPIKNFRNIQRGSILDFSARLDAPAGKYGPVQIRDGHLFFRDRPDTPIRFYGVNLCRSAQYLDRKHAEEFADRMAAWGVNAVRIHHHDNELTSRKNGSSTDLNPEMADRLDYLIACFKKRGIYITTDLYVSRMLVRGELREVPGQAAWQPTFKPLVFVLDSAMENWKSFARNWLTHVNPYTGLALREDPVLISLSLINEDNIANTWNAAPFVAEIYKKRFEAWKKEKKLRGGRADSNDPLFAAFLTETYNRAFAEMKRFLREELGVTVPLSDQNMLAKVLLAPMRDQYDFVENHFYWDHPNFPETPWQLPSALGNRSAIPEAVPAPGRLFPSRLYGKPMLITEFDFAAPNAFRAEGAPLTGAYAALQDWDALFHFTYSHSDDNVISDQFNPRGNFFNSSTDAVKALSQRIGLRLFLDRELRPASPAFAVALNGGKGMDFSLEYPSDIARLGLVAQVGTVMLPPGRALPRKFTALLDLGRNFTSGNSTLPVFHPAEAKKDLPEQLIRAGLLDPACYQAKTGTFLSSTGQLTLQPRTGIFRAVTPGCEALILPAKQSAAGKFLSVDNQIGRGVFSAMSADGKPLQKSSRILLLHLTDTLPDRTCFGDERMILLSRWGTLPFLAARGEAKITLRTAAGGNWKLYAVATDGSRTAEVPFQQRSGGEIQFRAEVFRKTGATLAYELIRDSGTAAD